MDVDTRVDHNNESLVESYDSGRGKEITMIQELKSEVVRMKRVMTNAHRARDLKYQELEEQLTALQDKVADLEGGNEAELTEQIADLKLMSEQEIERRERKEAVMSQQVADFKQERERKDTILTQQIADLKQKLERIETKFSEQIVVKQDKEMDLKNGRTHDVIKKTKLKSSADDIDQSNLQSKHKFRSKDSTHNHQYESYYADFSDNPSRILIQLKDFQSPPDAVKVGLGQELGAGGFGKVCKFETPKGLFAAKIFNQTSIQDYPERITRESVILDTCEDEHIVKYYGSCQILSLSPAPILVMELMETNFERYYMEGNVSLQCTTDILVQVAQGLEYLHCKFSSKIVHRDLTARNVLVKNAESLCPLAKITDFGLSQFVESMETVVSMTRVWATRYYLAPEVDSSEHRYNEKIDIFSLGHLALVSSLKEIIKELPDIRQSTERGYMALTEVQRRKKYFIDLSSKLKEKNHPFEILIKDCLDLDHKKRPSAKQLVDKLSVISEQFKDQSTTDGHSSEDSDPFFFLN